MSVYIEYTYTHTPCHTTDAIKNISISINMWNKK